MATEDFSKPSPRLIDLTGQPFDDWTVLSRAPKRGKATYWNCQCVCGKIKEIATGSLRSKHSTSCGCVGKERARIAAMTHGLSRTSEYNIWGAIVQRTTNPRAINWNNYGGRGIRLCQRWRTSFAAFFTDMGKRPSLRHSIDRKDNSGNYSCGCCPECVANNWTANCKWIATRKEQANNRRSNRLLTLGDLTLNLAQWSELRHIPRETLEWRLRKGKSIEEVLTPANRTTRFFTFNNETLTIKQWAHIKGMCYHTLNHRIKKWGDIERALTTPVGPSRWDH